MANAKEGKKKGGCLKAFLITLAVIVIVGGIAIYGGYKMLINKKIEDAGKAHTDELVGKEAPDFEVTTTDGKTVKMSELLEGKDALVVVQFASWCGPCKEEFPMMNEVYKKYQDKIAMIALDSDMTLDNDKSAKEYAATYGYSFPIAMANDSVGFILANSYPTTIVIDRNGKIGFNRQGMIPKAEDFEQIINTFTGDDYQERALGYYTLYAVNSKGELPGVEVEVTSKDGTQTYTTDEAGYISIFTDEPEDLKVKVTKVPEGCKIKGNGEASTGTQSGFLMLPIEM